MIDLIISHGFGFVSGAWAAPLLFTLLLTYGPVNKRENLTYVALWSVFVYFLKSFGQAVTGVSNNTSFVITFAISCLLCLGMGLSLRRTSKTE